MLAGWGATLSGAPAAWCSAALSSCACCLSTCGADLQMVNITLRVLSKPDVEQLPKIFRVSVCEQRQQQCCMERHVCKQSSVGSLLQHQAAGARWQACSRSCAGNETQPRRLLACKPAGVCGAAGGNEWQQRVLDRRPYAVSATAIRTAAALMPRAAALNPCAEPGH